MVPRGYLHAPLKHNPGEASPRPRSVEADWSLSHLSEQRGKEVPCVNLTDAQTAWQPQGQTTDAAAVWGISGRIHTSRWLLFCSTSLPQIPKQTAPQRTAGFTHGLPVIISRCENMGRNQKSRYEEKFRFSLRVLFDLKGQSALRKSNMQSQKQEVESVIWDLCLVLIHISNVS